MLKSLLLVLLSVTLTLPTLAQNASDKNIKEAAKNPESIKIDASDTIPWKYGGFAGLTFNQVALANWAAGGQSSLSFQVNVNLYAHYIKKHLLWDTDLNIAMGAIYIFGKKNYPFRKGADNFQLTTKAGYVINKKKTLSAVFLADLRSSMLPGYDYSDVDLGTAGAKSQLLSTPFSPSYLTLSIGLNYKPVPYFSLYFAPIAGKLTFFNQQVGKGVDSIYNTNDGTKFGLETPSTGFRGELGGYFRADFQKDLAKNVNFKTTFELFQNYNETKKKNELYDKDHPYEPQYYNNTKYTDVFWSTLLSLKVTKYFSATLETQLIWDYNTVVTNGDHPKGFRAAQFREAFGVNLAYKFSGNTVSKKK